MLFSAGIAEGLDRLVEASGRAGDARAGRQLLRWIQFRTLGAKHTEARVKSLVLNDDDPNDTWQDMFATGKVTL